MASSALSADKTPPAAWSVLLGLAAGRLGLHFIIGSGYGLFRDEFYYLACGARPDWGYVDQPPLVPMLARLAAAIWGYTTITAGELRTLSALAASGVIVLAGLMARELGGGRYAQGLAALAVFCGPFFLATGELFETVVFDELCWALTVWLVLRAWRHAPGAGWLLVGLAAGIGLETKFTMGLLGLGLAAALALDPVGRRHLRTPWPWLGGAIAFVLLAPNLWWQHTHGWPTAEFIHNNNAWNREEWSLGKFALSQLEYLNPVALALAGAGLWRVFSRRNEDGGRTLGWIFLVSLATLLVTLGKPYYLGSAYPGLLAVGAVAAEGWTAAQSARGRGRWWRPAVAGALILVTLPLTPVALPLVPRERLAGSWVAGLQHDFGETIGWPELTAQVEDVFLRLSPEEQVHTAVLTMNYGEAAAIEHFRRLPTDVMPVVSKHNNYWFWGPGPVDPQTLILVGTRHPERFEAFFGQIEKAAVIDNPLGLDNDERGAGIYVCRQPRVTLRSTWPGTRSFN